jgi:hypothetical protein
MRLWSQGRAVQASDVEAFRESINDVTSLMTFELDAILRDAFGTGADPVRIRDELLQVVPDVVSPYMDMASASAATWYEDMRLLAYDAPYQAEMFSMSEAAKSKAPLALASQPEQLDATIRNGLAPLFGKSGSSPLMLIGGGMQRHITNAARGTVIENARRDSVRVGYQRFTKAGCCKFCAMVASRGAVYGSRKAAGGQAFAQKYHDHCRCVVGPVFAGNEYAKTAQDEAEARFDELVGADLEREIARKSPK